jgi:hypothetical protein
MTAPEGRKNCTLTRLSRPSGALYGRDRFPTARAVGYGLNAPPGLAGPRQGAYFLTPNLCTVVVLYVSPGFSTELGKFS